MSYSILIGILLLVSSLGKYVFHIGFIREWFIIGLGIVLIWDLSWNEFLPRLFPNSFMTITITYVDKQKVGSVE